MFFEEISVLPYTTPINFNQTEFCETQTGLTVIDDFNPPLVIRIIGCIENVNFNIFETRIYIYVL